MAYLTNGTLNYNLTKDAACCEQQQAYIEDRNKMDPTYPDPNDSRFTDPAPVFTIQNNQLYRDGVAIGKIYNNKTGKLIEITDTQGTEITAKDTEDSATRQDVPIPTVEKLTGTKFTIEEIPEHDFVDLGLPSGTLWATMNVGATSPTEYGDYYMYGMGSKTYDNTDTPYDGTENPLDLTKDTARQVWGGDWHMPTKAQLQELTANTTYQWATDYEGSGINGGTFTATNGAVLFLPAAGYWYGGGQLDIGDYGGYWGSSPGGSNGAYLLNFYDGYKGVDYNDRKDGYSVRPVIG